VCEDREGSPIVGCVLKGTVKGSQNGIGVQESGGSDSETASNKGHSFVDQRMGNMSGGEMQPRDIKGCPKGVLQTAGEWFVFGKLR